MERLAEIDGLRTDLARNPDHYPFGLGPVERLSEDFITGRISIKDALHEAGLPKIAEAVSSVYLHSISWQAIGLCETSEWRRGVIVYRLLSEATLAADESLIIPADVADIIAAVAHVTVLAFARGVDDAMYYQAVSVLARLIVRADSNGELGIFGDLLQALASLHSDHYTVPRSVDPSQTRIDLRIWLKRPHVASSVFPDLHPPEVYPPPVAALTRAVSLYEQALPLRDGLKKGLTYKAIAQTLFFISEYLGEPIPEERLKSAVFHARILLSKHPDPSHLSVIEEIIEAKNYSIERTNIIRAPGLVSLLDQLAIVSRATSVSDPATRSNSRALAELRRALAYGLPFCLYLRNFLDSDMIHQISPPFAIESSTGLIIVDPKLTYSIVDHKLLSLFPEGVIGVANLSS